MLMLKGRGIADISEKQNRSTSYAQFLLFVCRTYTGNDWTRLTV